MYANIVLLFIVFEMVVDQQPKLSDTFYFVAADELHFRKSLLDHAELSCDYCAVTIQKIFYIVVCFLRLFPSFE